MVDDSDQRLVCSATQVNLTSVFEALGRPVHESGDTLLVIKQYRHRLLHCCADRIEHVILLNRLLTPNLLPVDTDHQCAISELATTEVDAERSFRFDIRLLGDACEFLNVGTHLLAEVLYGPAHRIRAFAVKSCPHFRLSNHRIKVLVE